MEDSRSLPDEKTPELEASWLAVLEDEFQKDYMLELKKFLVDELKKHVVYPEPKNIFKAFQLCPFDKLKVVILGQDPYHGPGQAHGLCFSVPRGVKAPPSLVNIFKELQNDLSISLPQNPCLESWARQGVLLLNTCLTVRKSQAASHQNRGWEIFTDRVIEVINEKREGLVFLLWGRHARNKKNLINPDWHWVLEAAHPSPFSAHHGFFGCRHFSKTNWLLEQQEKSPIQWSLES
jgi:uracil-DNA glycosylase